MKATAAPLLLLLGVLVASCARPLTQSSLQEPEFHFDTTVMDGPLQCLAQKLWRDERPPLTRGFLKQARLRIGKIPDVSGKTVPSSPSDNPKGLQTYVQVAVAELGLFDIMSIDETDLPRRGGQPHVPSAYPADLLIQGALDGDSEFSSQSADVQLGFGPLQLFWSGRERHITQRLMLELVDSNSGTVISRIVRDPYARVSRRMHLVSALRVYLPENSAQIGNSFSNDTSDISVATGGDVRATIDRPRATQLAVKVVLFELLRRMSDSYAAGDACLTPASREYIQFSTSLRGVIVDPDAPRPQAAAPANPAPSVAPPRVVPRQHAPAPKTGARPAPRKRMESSALARSSDGRNWKVSARHLQPKGARAGDVGSLMTHLPAAIRRQVGSDAELALFNTLNVTLEGTPRQDQDVRADFGRHEIRIATSKVTLVQAPWGPTYCRLFHLEIDRIGTTGLLSACRDRGRAVWLVTEPSTSTPKKGTSRHAA